MPAGLGCKEYLSFYMLQLDKVTLSRALKKKRRVSVWYLGKNSTKKGFTNCRGRSMLGIFQER